MRGPIIPYPCPKGYFHKTGLSPTNHTTRQTRHIIATAAAAKSPPIRISVSMMLFIGWP